jgi:hypothetical protein
MQQQENTTIVTLIETTESPVRVWMYFVAYVIPYCVLAGIALFWPAHTAPWGLDFTQSTWARMVPSISAYIEKSEFPQATAAYFVLSGILSLPFLLFTFRHPTLIFGSNKRRVNAYQKYKETRWKSWGATLVLVPIGVWICWIQPGYQYGVLPIHNERWALALFGCPFSFYCMTYYLIAIVRLMLNFEQLFTLERKYHGME